MSVQAFITSGILEKYVMGLADQEELNEVLEMASQHLEIKEELAAIRKTLQGYIVSHQVMPPESLKEKILVLSDQKVAASSTRETPSASKKASYQTSKSKSDSNNGINMAGIAAGLLALALIAVCFTAYSFYSDVEAEKANTQIANEKIATIEKQIVTEQERTKEVQSKLDFYTDPANQVIVLKGTRRSPNTRAIIYYNKSARTMSLDLKEMPTVRAGKVAVLWANADRRSNKIGTIKVNAPGERSIFDFVDNAEMIYVTEEDNAEADRPNRARILMNGNF